MNTGWRFLKLCRWVVVAMAGLCWVSVVSADEGPLFVKAYPVSKEKYEAAAATAGVAPRQAKEVLMQNEIVFGDGASAIYNPASGQLVVRNTEPQLKAIEEWIQDLSGDP